MATRGPSIWTVILMVALAAMLAAAVWALFRAQVRGLDEAAATPPTSGEMAPPATPGDAPLIPPQVPSS